ncbi:MAG: 3-methyl-2-oxobutanoate hydroxymethyltransferase [Thermostichales cyanobacterium SZTDM-1c_bins_54]
MARSWASLQQAKQQGRKIVALTAYDAPTAKLVQAAGLDLIIVGDSVGTNVLGYGSEQEVTLADILHHLRAVRRGSPDLPVIADLPYGTYSSVSAALDNAQALMAAGADAVKLEGPEIDTVKALVQAGIPVCGHLGLLPQTQQERRLQGKTLTEAQAIWQGSLALQGAGVVVLVLELIPWELAGWISRQLAIPTIGIGSGWQTDGQVLVVQDVLGMSERQLRLAKAYAQVGEQMLQAFRLYAQEVRQGHFPAPEHARPMPPATLAAFQAWLAETGGG